MLKKLGYGLRTGCGGTDSPSYLDSVLSSAVLDLDATVAASYPGTGQIWANLISSPADGAAQTDYDFYKGKTNAAASDDPTFNGSAGDSSAYFSLDGGDCFTSAGAGGPTLANMHKKTGGTNAWWAAIALNRAGGQTLWGGAWTAQTDSSGFFTWGNNIYQDINGTDSGLATAGLLPTIGVDTLLIVSVNVEATTGNVRWWRNTTTAASASKNWTGASNNDASRFAIGGSLGTSGGVETMFGFLSNGTRIYHFSMGNEFLDDAKAAAVVAHLEARHGRDYTP